jgi:hypothetical protein
MKPFVFTEQEELDLAATHIVADNKRLVELAKWKFIKEWEGMNCTNVTAKMVHDVALRYRRTLPKAVRQELSEWALPIKKKQEERRRLQDELNLKLLAYDRASVFTDAYSRKNQESVSAKMKETRAYKRWAVLLINEAKGLFRKHGFTVPRITVEFFKSPEYGGRCLQGISRESDGGYTIHTPILNFGLVPFSMPVPRWNGRLAAHFNPSHMSKATFLDLVIENGSPRLHLVSPDFGHYFSPYIPKYIFHGIMDVDFLDKNGSPVKKTYPVRKAVETLNVYARGWKNEDAFSFTE